MPEIDLEDEDFRALQEVRIPAVSKFLQALYSEVEFERTRIITEREDYPQFEARKLNIKRLYDKLKEGDFTNPDHKQEFAALLQEINEVAAEQDKRPFTGMNAYKLTDILGKEVSFRAIDKNASATLEKIADPNFYGEYLNSQPQQFAPVTKETQKPPSAPESSSPNTQEGGPFLFAIDADNTIFKGHSHNTFTNARILPQKPGESIPENQLEYMYNLLLQKESDMDIFKHKDNMLEAIRTAIDNGHHVSIASYTKYPDFINFALGKMGLEEKYLQQIVVQGGFPDENGEPKLDGNVQDKSHGKEGHIRRIQQTLGTNIPANNIILFDDSPNNISIAKEKGHIAISCPVERDCDNSQLLSVVELAKQKSPKLAQAAYSPSPNTEQPVSDKIAIKKDDEYPLPSNITSHTRRRKKEETVERDLQSPDYFKSLVRVGKDPSDNILSTLNQHYTNGEKQRADQSITQQMMLKKVEDQARLFAMEMNDRIRERAETLISEGRTFPNIKHELIQYKNHLSSRNSEVIDEINQNFSQQQLAWVEYSTLRSISDGNTPSNREVMKDYAAAILKQKEYMDQLATSPETAGVQQFIIKNDEIENLVKSTQSQARDLENPEYFERVLSGKFSQEEFEALTKEYGISDQHPADTIVEHFKKEQDELHSLIKNEIQAKIKEVLGDKPSTPESKELIEKFRMELLKKHREQIIKIHKGHRTDQLAAMEYGAMMTLNNKKEVTPELKIKQQQQYAVFLKEKKDYLEKALKDPESPLREGFASTLADVTTLLTAHDMGLEQQKPPKEAPTAQKEQPLKAEQPAAPEKPATPEKAEEHASEETEQTPPEPAPKTRLFEEPDRRLFDEGEYQSEIFLNHVAGLEDTVKKLDKFTGKDILETSDVDEAIKIHEELRSLENAKEKLTTEIQNRLEDEITKLEAQTGELAQIKQFNFDDFRVEINKMNNIMRGFLLTENDPQKAAEFMSHVETINKNFEAHVKLSSPSPRTLMKNQDFISMQQENKFLLERLTDRFGLTENQLKTEIQTLNGMAESLKSSTKFDEQKITAIIEKTNEILKGVTSSTLLDQTTAQRKYGDDLLNVQNAALKHLAVHKVEPRSLSQTVLKVAESNNDMMKRYEQLIKKADGARKQQAKASEPAKQKQERLAKPTTYKSVPQLNQEITATLESLRKAMDDLDTADANPNTLERPSNLLATAGTKFRTAFNTIAQMSDDHFQRLDKTHVLSIMQARKEYDVLFGKVREHAINKAANIPDETTPALDQMTIEETIEMLKNLQKEADKLNEESKNMKFDMGPAEGLIKQLEDVRDNFDPDIYDQALKEIQSLLSKYSGHKAAVSVNKVETYYDNIAQMKNEYGEALKSVNKRLSNKEEKQFAKEYSVNFQAAFSTSSIMQSLETVLNSKGNMYSQILGKELAESEKAARLLSARLISSVGQQLTATPWDLDLQMQERTKAIKTEIENIILSEEYKDIATKHPNMAQALKDLAENFELEQLARIKHMYEQKLKGIDNSHVITEAEASSRVEVKSEIDTLLTTLSNKESAFQLLKESAKGNKDMRRRDKAELRIIDMGVLNKDTLMENLAGLAEDLKGINDLDKYHEDNPEIYEKELNIILDKAKDNVNSHLSGFDQPRKLLLAEIERIRTNSLDILHKTTPTQDVAPTPAVNFVQPNKDIPVEVAGQAKTGMFDASFGQADIIVNAASVDGHKPKSWGGIAGAIFNAVDKAEGNGRQTLEAEWNNNMENHTPGQARVVGDSKLAIAPPFKGTQPQYNQAYLIHAYSPKDQHSDHKTTTGVKEDLFQAYYGALARGAELAMKEGKPLTMALPPLGIGIYEVDTKLSAEMAATAMQAFYQEHPELKEQLKVKVPIYDEKGDMPFQKALVEALNTQPELSLKMKELMKQSDIATQYKSDESLESAQTPEAKFEAQLKTKLETPASVRDYNLKVCYKQLENMKGWLSRNKDMTTEEKAQHLGEFIKELEVRVARIKDHRGKEQILEHMFKDLEKSIKQFSAQDVSFSKGMEKIGQHFEKENDTYAFRDAGVFSRLMNITAENEEVKPSKRAKLSAQKHHDTKYALEELTKAYHTYREEPSKANEELVGQKIENLRKLEHASPNLIEHTVKIEERIKENKKKALQEESQHLINKHTGPSSSSKPK